MRSLSGKDNRKKTRWINCIIEDLEDLLEDAAKLYGKSDTRIIKLQKALQYFKDGKIKVLFSYSSLTFLRNPRKNCRILPRPRSRRSRSFSQSRLNSSAVSHI